MTAKCNEKNQKAKLKGEEKVLLQITNAIACFFLAICIGNLIKALGMHMGWYIDENPDITISKLLLGANFMGTMFFLALGLSYIRLNKLIPTFICIGMCGIGMVMLFADIL